MKNIEAVIQPHKIEEVKEALINTLCAAARTGKIGDGKIFVSSMEDAVRIRNGEHGEMAL